MENSNSCNLRHSRGLLFNMARIINERDDQTIYKDLDLICRDGVVRWNKFLLAANSPILRQVLDHDEDSSSIVLLPDVTASTVNSMLKCTVNPTVRSDTLSVNELEVMRLLGFSLLCSKSQLPCQSPFDQIENLGEEDSGELNRPEDLSSQELEHSLEREERGDNGFPLKRSKSKTRDHTTSRSFNCDDPNCGMTFQRRLHLERHLASHSKAEDKVCDICGKVFHHEDNLRLHLSYHKDVLQAHQCSHCDKTLNGRRALKLHIDSVHAAKAECQFCGKKMTKRLLKRHLARKHKDELSANAKDSKDGAIFCHVCQRQFLSAQALAVHRRSHHGLNGFLNSEQETEKASKSDAYVTCDVCYKLFASRHHLMTHTRRCHLKTHETCQECGKAVKDLKQHSRVVHEKVAIVIQAALENKMDEIPEKSVRKSISRRKQLSTSKSCCQVCGKDYHNAHGLARHLREVHAENRYECPLCGHFFPVRHSLERHIRNVHHPVKHECPYCGVAVIHLAVHLNSAHGLDPANAKEVAEARTGKSAARTDLTLDWVIQRKRYQQELLCVKTP